MKNLILFITLFTSISVYGQDWIYPKQDQEFFLIDKRPAQFYLVKIDCYYWHKNTLYIKYTYFEGTTGQNKQVKQVLPNGAERYDIIEATEIKTYLLRHKCKKVKYAYKDNNRGCFPVPQQSNTGNQTALVEVLHQKEKNGSHDNSSSNAIFEGITR